MASFNKITIDIFLVKALIASQFPQWGHLEIKPVEHGGWDNRTFHLGDTMLIRLPSAECYASKVEKEQRWLPKLAPFLPLAIPAPVAMGNPTREYPWHWSIYKWIEGETVSDKNVVDQIQFARDLAQFLVALQKIDTTGGPIAGEHNFYRGGSLRVYDSEVREALRVLGDSIDSAVVTELWNRALEVEWNKDPVWIHGDIAVGNLLIEDGKLKAVIDFGGLAIGDPACDYVIAWTFLTQESRHVFKEALSVDNATWNRARGWVLWKALIICAQLCGTDSNQQKQSRKVLQEILI